LGKSALNDAYAAYVKDPTTEDAFYTVVREFCTATVAQHSYGAAAFSSMEDVIQESLIEVWRRFPKYDSSIGPFANFVALITLHNIKDGYRKYLGERGGRQRDGGYKHVVLEEDAVISSEKELRADKKVMLEEWFEQLPPEGRTLMQLTIDGLTQEETAEVFRVSHQAISKRLTSLRKRLKSPF